ncbi:MAG: HNH endonuclease [Candidatus Cloacimonetes bacterium]|nr:HNH endonuclease [Candidatus Cloacimonadota bacterium]
MCGNIPIVYHHIEEWAKEKSNDESLLIPVCNKCHRDIHSKSNN